MILVALLVCLTMSFLGDLGIQGRQLSSFQAPALWDYAMPTTPPPLFHDASPTTSQRNSSFLPLSPLAGR